MTAFSPLVSPSASSTLPGPRGLPLLGSYLDLRRDPLSFFEHLAHRYGDTVAFRIGPRRALFLNDPSLIERMLVAEHRDFPKISFLWRQFTAVFGQGLVTSHGPLWQRQRRLCAPAFAPARLAAYAEVMVRTTDQTLEGWRVGEVRDLHADMMALTLRIVAKTLFGVGIETDISRIEAAVHDLSREMAARMVRPILIPDAVPLPGHLRYRHGLACIEDLATRIIRERRTAGGRNLLDALMDERDESGTPMSDHQLRDEAVTFLLAGHETTALALTWALYLLGQHREVSAALAAEADAVLGERPATFEHLQRLTLAEQVMNESLRLYPPAWLIGREAGRDCEIGGQPIRAGTPLYTSPWVLHRDPRFWSEPLSFRPGRWAGYSERRLPRFAYMPFGGGPRVCIAQRFAMTEGVLILASIVRRFSLVPIQEAPVVPFPSITLRPADPVRFRVHAR
ncbi:cytochrome P450 [Methylobacterium sp. P31]